MLNLKADAWIIGIQSNLVDGHDFTIPLTFNLRPRNDDAWRLVELSHGRARLEISDTAGKMLAQVDCQHRLGAVVSTLTPHYPNMRDSLELEK